jgi:hypothetical protein
MVYFTMLSEDSLIWSIIVGCPMNTALNRMETSMFYFQVPSRNVPMWIEEND